MAHQKKGFTLIELLIVVVIIGTLASLILPRFGSVHREKAIMAEALNFLSALRRGQEIFFNENGMYVIIPDAEACDQGESESKFLALGVQMSAAYFGSSPNCASTNPFAYSTSTLGDGTIIATRSTEPYDELRLTINGSFATSTGEYAPGKSLAPE